MVVGDASRPDHGSGYDRVLVDPPCSDLGTLQSRPDARWRKGPEAIERLVPEQAAILARAATQEALAEVVGPYQLEEAQLQEVIAGMAMDLDGALRGAVPVEKARGQAIFEDVTRARIDPALLQQTIGNNYKLRVFPILPNASKIVVIRYMESLRRSGERHAVVTDWFHPQWLAVGITVLLLAAVLTERRQADDALFAPALSHQRRPRGL